MTLSLRVGIVGAGWVSAHHLVAWNAVRDATVVAIADIDAGKAHDRAREFGIPAIRQTAAEMLDRDDLDALDIATPVDTHATLCRLGAARGVAMLCQKPLAASYAEAQQVVQEIAGRARLMVHENWRFRPHYRRVKQWLDRGLIGAPCQFRLASRSSGLIAAADGTLPALVRQPFLAKLRRLVIGELLIHHLDVARWLLGPLEVRDALARSGIVEGEHAATMLLASPPACMAIVEGNLAAPGYPPAPVDALEIVGTTGTIRLADDIVSLCGETREQHRFDPIGDYRQSYVDVVSHFACSLRTHEPFETDAVDNLATLALVDAAYTRLGT